YHHLVLYHHLADQAVREGRSHPDRHVGTRLETVRFHGGKVQSLILRRSADPLTPRFVLPFNHYFECLADVLPIPALLYSTLLFEQYSQAPRLLLVRNRIMHCDRWRVRTRRIFEGKDPVIFNFVKKR